MQNFLIKYNKFYQFIYQIYKYKNNVGKSDIEYANLYLYVS